jgi:hypothetical protein
MKPKPLTKANIVYTGIFKNYPDNTGWPFVAVRDVLGAVEWLKDQVNEGCAKYPKDVLSLHEYIHTKIDEAFDIKDEGGE